MCSMPHMVYVAVGILFDEGHGWLIDVSFIPFASHANSSKNSLPIIQSFLSCKNYKDDLCMVRLERACYWRCYVKCYCAAGFVSAQSTVNKWAPRGVISMERCISSLMVMDTMRSNDDDSTRWCRWYGDATRRLHIASAVEGRGGRKIKVWRRQLGVNVFMFGNTVVFWLYCFIK